MTKNKIYNGYAFTENESDKYKSNKKAYEELKSKYKIHSTEYKAPTEDELNNNDIVFIRKAQYHKAKYTFFKYPDGLTDDELCLICDCNIFNLCFGGRICSYVNNKAVVEIYED